MARLLFSLRAYNELTADGWTHLSGTVSFRLDGNNGTAPEIRAYEIGKDPEPWQSVTPNEFKDFGFNPGTYQLDYRDSNGFRALCKINILSQAEIACLNIADGGVNLFFPWFTVEADRIRVLGYPTATGEVAINGSEFKTWNATFGAIWTNSELSGLGVTDNIDAIKVRTTGGECTLTPFEDVFLGEPTEEFKASISKTDVTAPGAEDGTITVTVSGGSTPYTFEWNDESTDQNRTGLGPGTYSVIVTDNDGLQIPLQTTITEPAAVSEDLTEELLIEVRPAPCHPVTLCWLNSLGSYESFCFEDLNGTFEHEIKTRIDAEFERFVEDLETDTNNTGITRKTIQRSLKLGADSVDPDIFVGLLDLLTSAAVFMLTSTDPITWQAVTVTPGSFKYSEYDRALEFAIELPNMFVQGA